MHRCKYCSWESERYTDYLKHIGIHEQEEDFSLQCESCYKAFRSVAVYKKHRYWHQVKDKRDLSARQTESCSHSGSFLEQGDTDPVRDRSPLGQDDDESIKDQDVHLDAEISHLTPSFLDRSESTSIPGSSWIDVADFMLSLRAKSVPKRVCQDIVHEFKRFGSRVQAETESSCRETRSRGDVAAEADSPSLKGLNNIDTYHKLLKFSKEERGFIEPIPQFTDEGSAGKPVSQYIPLTSQLRACLQCPDVHKRLTSHGEHTTAKYKSVFDGCMHQQGTENLHLIFYYDEFTIANPIGNKTTKHSIGAIYYCIANTMRLSSLKDIHVAMLFHSRDVKRLSWEKILHPLVKEMTMLETEGISYMHNGLRENKKCIVAMFVCDNKGSHQLAGYYTSFHRTNRICRHCHALTDEIQTQFEEACFEDRTREQYDCEINHLKMENFDSNMKKNIRHQRRMRFEQGTIISLHYRLPGRCNSRPV